MYVYNLSILSGISHYIFLVLKLPSTIEIISVFLGLKEPLLKILSSLKLLPSNSSQISKSRRLKSVIFLRNIIYNINK